MKKLKEDIVHYLNYVGNTCTGFIPYVRDCAMAWRFLVARHSERSEESSCRGTIFISKNPPTGYS